MSYKYVLKDPDPFHQDLHAFLTSMFRGVDIWVMTSEEVARAAVEMAEGKIRQDEAAAIAELDVAPTARKFAERRALLHQLLTVIDKQHRPPTRANSSCCRGNDDLHNTLLTLDAQVRAVMLS